MPAVKQQYRPEIDGMRALAVLAVVGFHAGVPGLPGGFAGVDIFFVISGYLITQVILLDADRGAFSFIKFYERRVRRIMPALLVMMAVTSLAAWLLMLPDDLVGVSKSVFSMTLFSSNFYFWRLSQTYFTPQAVDLPLLHTWSLAVEEQFYLVFPIFLMAIRPLGTRATGFLLSLIALLSFALDVWLLAEGHSQAAFYIPVARAWELMLGALLTTDTIPRVFNRHAGDLLAWGGAILIFVSFVWLDSMTSFPGAAAFPPCCGTLMLLRGTEPEGSGAARLLGITPLRMTGLASYSIYLWHWPFIVFASYWITDPALWFAVKLSAALLALPAGYFSWKYIESPFRGGQALFSRPMLFRTVAAASAALALIGVVGIFLKGMPGRFPADKIAQLVQVPYQNPCHNQSLTSLQQGQFCRIGDPAAKPVFMIWGDSHADMYYKALDSRAAQHGIAGYIVSTSSCPPLIGLNVEATGSRSCEQRNMAVRSQIARLHPKAVILAARWSAYNVEQCFFASACLVRKLDIRVSGRAASDQSVQIFRSKLMETAAFIRAAGGRTLFLADDPTAAMPVALLMAKANILGTTVKSLSANADGIAMTKSDYAAQGSLANGAAASLAQKGVVRIVDPGPFLCGATICPVQRNGTPWYRDMHHLTPEGARLAAAAFEPMLQSLVGR